MRINNATSYVGQNATVDLDLGRSAVGASRYENKDLASVDGHNFLVLCDVIYSTSSGSGAQFRSSFAGSSGSADNSRQAPLTSTSTVIARDEFWGLGSGLSPQGNGLSLTNATVNVGDCVLAGVIHS
jgi:hypothetical protein